MVEFAINSTINGSIGHAPFELNYGYMPHMLQSFPDGKDFPPGVTAFANRALHYLVDAHDTIIALRVFQTHYVDKRRGPEPIIREGDLIYLSTKNLNTPKG